MNEPTKNICSLVSSIFLGELHYVRRKGRKEEWEGHYSLIPQVTTVLDSGGPEVNKVGMV